jgi:ATP diphosphatase
MPAAVMPTTGMPTTIESPGNPPLAINAPVRRLIAIMAALRTPKTGCPWDLEQTHASIAPYALEEAYEVVDAIERGDMDDLRDELGDLLLQVVYHSRLAEEAGAFSFDDVAEGVARKMVRRHPHVFDVVEKKQAFSGVDKIWEAMRAKREARDSGKSPSGLVGAIMESERMPKAASVAWETIKAQERGAKNAGSSEAPSLLADTPKALPGLTRAVKLQAKASRVGFDWGDAKQVLAKLREEIDEIEAELDGGKPEAISDEIGDLIFAVANLARHASTDPETAVRGANAKFERRFAYIEAALAARGTSPAGSTLAEMEALWTEAKQSGL